MKKVLAFFLAACMLVLFVGCSGKMTPAEKFLLAVKKMDFTAMKNELIPDEKLGSLYLKLETAPQEDTLLVLRNLYALVHYTIGEVSEAENGVKTVRITLKTPDMERICNLARVEAMASADSAEQIVGNMIADGSVSGSMMLENTFSVKMTEADGVWKIPYGDKENEAFANALAIEDMIAFFIKY